MNVELTQDQVNKILKSAQEQVADEAIRMLRGAVQANMPQWVAEVKNTVKTSLANTVAQDVIKRLDVNGCVDKAMESVNKRIHTEITRRIQNGIMVQFQAVLAKPEDE